MSVQSFVREKRIYQGKNFLDVEIYNMFDIKERGRKKELKKSSMKQVKQNDKNARKYFRQLVNTNFGKGDFCVHATYDEKTIPETVDAAEKYVLNYLRRLDYRRKKNGLKKIKYIIVTEYRTKNNGVPTRIHHHIIMDGKLDRETVEDLWRMRRKRGEKQGLPIGTINVDRLQPDEYGLEALAQYLTKGLTGQKRWHPSQNLKKPVVKKNDYKWSYKKLVRLADQTDCNEIWEKLYPGYRVTKCQSAYGDELGWSITIRMRREGEWRIDTIHNTGEIAGAERLRASMSSRDKKRKPHVP